MGNVAIYDNLDGPWRHYAKWGESKTNTMISLTREIWNSLTQKQSGGCQESGAGENGETLVWKQMSSYKMKKFWWSTVQHGDES